MSQEHPRQQIRDCANQDGQIQLCACGGRACPGWCHVLSTDSRSGVGHHCWPPAVKEQPRPQGEYRKL